MTLLDTLDATPSDEELRYLLEEPSLSEERKFIESLWKKYEPYADRHFKSEITHNFHNRFWEMYLACSLMDFGFELAQMHEEKGPDICLHYNNSRVWIEAVAPSGGQGPDAIIKEESKPGEIKWFSVPTDKIILRCRSSIKEKHDKYRTYLQDGTVSATEPYIIALNGRRIPYSRTSGNIPYIVKAVLPFGEQTYEVDFDRNGIVDQWYPYRDEIAKTNKAKVSTKIFLDPDYSGISGILFSNIDLLNRPRDSGVDFKYIHNPLGSNPLQQGWLSAGREFWMENEILHRHIWN